MNSGISSQGVSSQAATGTRRERKCWITKRGSQLQLSSHLKPHLNQSTNAPDDLDLLACALLQPRRDHVPHGLEDEGRAVGLRMSEKHT